MGGELHGKLIVIKVKHSKQINLGGWQSDGVNYMVNYHDYR